MLKSMCARTSSLTIAIALSAGLAGCGSAPVQVGQVSSTRIADYGQSDYSAKEDTDYILRPSDVINVTVFREPDLSVAGLPVGSDGVISLPLIGAIKAEGLTARGLSEKITQKLSVDVLRNPSVAVNVVQFGSHLVTVEGSVEKPGMYPFRPGTRLSGAISLASGPSRVAKLKEVAVFRQTSEGTFIAKFDYAAVRAGTMLDPVMQPNDRIVVGTSGLSQFWQDLLKTLPALALFTQI
ncbi:polysaccharide biosynthesis/export family protein [Novosphingobium sp. CECT 9465]|uniref:polysaccharide biosynthesis/export family protein n=1 Tax=Novosphingobium sp. CECT 9465 TaxID=2829794 RepID=UPI001E284283|nr:polysaccharide biosynthesis/export family protein [Novosphingobium sp. CECT 9465]CAH0497924.1 hypothetical protein NVSP9465_02996 [Novosphingobium sp. CECT 9465]